MGLVLLPLSVTHEVFAKVLHDVSQEVVINSETLKCKCTLCCINKSGLTKVLLLVPSLLDCHRLPESIWSIYSQVLNVYVPIILTALRENT